MAEGRDHKQLVDLLEVYLLGEEPSLTGKQIAENVGIEFDEARRLWRSLGFTDVGGDVAAFTHADQEALELTQRLLHIGLIEDGDQSALVRTLGHSFARLAEWQMGLLAKVIDPDNMSFAELGEVMNEVTPAVESLQQYVWRRHALSAASRILIASQKEDDEAHGEEDGDVQELGPVKDDGTVLGVGFADIVGYTRQSRSLTRTEIGALIDHFEDRALEIIAGRGGRIIKTIGDEVLFVADDPESLARIGLELAEERLKDEEFPEVRVGLAWGPALARLGDVLGPVVNVASRLTSTARPGRVLVDRALAEELEDNEHFKFRKLRRTAVRGYRRLEPWSLRRPTDEDPEISEDGKLPGPASAFLHQQTTELLRRVDQLGGRLERPADGESAD